jgi:hypothetical protein
LQRGVHSVIFEQARTPATKSFLAGFLDAYISQAVGPCVLVKTPYGELLPTLAFVTIFGPAGSGKSPMGKLFRKHFDRWIEAYAASTRQAWQEYEALQEVWNAQRAGILKAIKKNAALGHPVDVGLQQRLIELEKSVPKMPPSPPRRFENTTFTPWMEEAAKHPATLFFADEGGPILAGMEKDLIGALCSSWSDMSLSHARSNTGVQIVRAMPTVILSIQTNVLRGFLATPKGIFYEDSGKAGRHLYYGVHESDFATQSFTLSDELDTTALKILLKRAEYFFRMQDQFNQDGWENRKVLELTQPAIREFHDVERYLHGLRSSAVSAGELAVIDKASQNILRHAARHHEFAGIEGPIGADEIADSAEWVLWSLDNYLHLTEQGQTSGRNPERDAETLWDLMCHGLRVRDCKIKKRQLSEEAFNIGLVRSTHFNAALGVLCQQGRATCRNRYVYWDGPDRLGHLLCKY